MSTVNSQLLKHKLILGVDDRGKISCHKVNLCFIYFDPSDCIVRKVSHVLFLHRRLKLFFSHIETIGNCSGREARGKWVHRSILTRNRTV